MFSLNYDYIIQRLQHCVLLNCMQNTRQDGLQQHLACSNGLQVIR